LDPEVKNFAPKTYTTTAKTATTAKIIAINIRGELFFGLSCTGTFVSTGTAGGVGGDGATEGISGICGTG
jgi:hypothetical protein